MSYGTCVFCQEIFSKVAITKHLSSCKKRSVSKEATTPLYHLVVQTRHASEFWLHLEVPIKLTLESLDDFLRDIWLECCGHLSLFRIGEETFVSYPDKAMGDRSMNISLEKIVVPGAVLAYEYDFGTTTYLTLKVLGEYRGEDSKKPRLLARNNFSKSFCSCCKNEASQMCIECEWDEKTTPLLCDSCAAKHEHGEEMFLPIVNSPRAGVCGYTG